jgi:hypothetical protein
LIPGLYRNSPENVSCLISKLLLFWFFERRFLLYTYRENNDPRGGTNFKLQGFYLNKLGRDSLEDVSCQIPENDNRS